MNALIREFVGLVAVLCLAVAATVWEKKVNERAANLQSPSAWDVRR